MTIKPRYVGKSIICPLADPGGFAGCFVSGNYFYRDRQLTHAKAEVE